MFHISTKVLFPCVMCAYFGLGNARNRFILSFMVILQAILICKGFKWFMPSNMVYLKGISSFQKYISRFIELKNMSK